MAEQVGGWRRRLPHDPVRQLLAAGDAALAYFVRRDLLGDRVPPVRTLWQLPELEKIVRRQRPDGSFKYPGIPQKHLPAQHYKVVETWKQLRFLVGKQHDLSGSVGESFEHWLARAASDPSHASGGQRQNVSAGRGRPCVYC